MVAIVEIGSGLAIAITTPAPEPGESRKVFAHRFGGLVAAVTGGIGIYYGGWRMGWLYAIGGYLLGRVAELILSLGVKPPTSATNVLTADPQSTDQPTRKV